MVEMDGERGAVRHRHGSLWRAGAAIERTMSG
jgi:hypothetical protein